MAITIIKIKFDIKNKLKGDNEVKNQERNSYQKNKNQIEYKN